MKPAVCLGVQIMTMIAPKLLVEETISIPDTFFRMSVERYHQMIAAGIFTEDDEVELLEGWIVNKMAKNRPHTKATNLIRRALEGLITAVYYLDAQEPITLTDSEPEPDIIVVRGSLFDYDQHPQAKDVALVVEVADTTLRRDQNWKKQLYARDGIPVYWVVNLPDRQIELYTDPTGNAASPNYRQLRTYAPDEMLPVILDGQTLGYLAVKSLLP